MKSLSAKQLYDKKSRTISIDDERWAKLLGQPESAGIWIIYGAEKNGKTWAGLQLANVLSKSFKVEYISAEEGLGDDFRRSCKRAGLSHTNKSIKFRDYEAWEDIDKVLKSTRRPKVLFIDNVTIYADELDKKAINELRHNYPTTIFIFLAHEERNDAVPALAKHIKKLAKIIIRVKGLAAEVAGRCPGGSLPIEEDKAALYHGNHIRKVG
ncbi:MAG: hypothetical protein IE931_05705 [Sphingobacteriales bacterium]|nr:hypothetical protein [Sphingobacteriales bacterium]